MICIAILLPEIICLIITMKMERKSNEIKLPVIQLKGK